MCQKVQIFSRHGLSIGPERFPIDFHQNQIIFSTPAAFFYFSHILPHKIAQNLKWPYLSHFWSEWTEILHGCPPYKTASMISGNLKNKIFYFLFLFESHSQPLISHVA